KTIRAQRRALKDLRSDNTITPSQYRYFYRKAKGGSYRSVAHLKTNIELEGIEMGGEA
ncbi:MAG TPA: 50S ribosomal protein L19e, partial [Candidatus Thalassarchaeaceae archaeon]